MSSLELVTKLHELHDKVLQPLTEKDFYPCRLEALVTRSNGTSTLRHADLNLAPAVICWETARGLSHADADLIEWRASSRNDLAPPDPMVLPLPNVPTPRSRGMLFMFAAHELQSFWSGFIRTPLDVAFLAPTPGSSWTYERTKSRIPMVPSSWTIESTGTLEPLSDDSPHEGRHHRCEGRGTAVLECRRGLLREILDDAHPQDTVQWKFTVSPDMTSAIADRLGLLSFVTKLSNQCEVLLNGSLFGPVKQRTGMVPLIEPQTQGSYSRSVNRQESMKPLVSLDTPAMSLDVDLALAAARVGLAADFNSIYLERWALGAIRRETISKQVVCQLVDASNDPCAAPLFSEIFRREAAQFLKPSE